MTTKTISLNTIVDVKEFVNTVARYDFEAVSYTHLDVYKRQL